MAIALVSLGIVSAVVALTKANAFASVSRNSTGAYAAVLSQIDLIQSIGPFNPQSGQIPKDLTNTPPLYDLTPGPGNTPITHAIGAPGNTANIPVYQYTDPATGLQQVVGGAMNVTITPDNDTTAFPDATVIRYRAKVALDYTYLGRNYSVTVDTVRVSDQ